MNLEKKKKFWVVATVGVAILGLVLILGLGFPQTNLFSGCGGVFTPSHG